MLGLPTVGLGGCCCLGLPTGFAASMPSTGFTFSSKLNLSARPPASALGPASAQRSPSPGPGRPGPSKRRGGAGRRQSRLPVFGLPFIAWAPPTKAELRSLRQTQRRHCAGGGATAEVRPPPSSRRPTRSGAGTAKLPSPSAARPSQP